MAESPDAPPDKPDDAPWPHGPIGHPVDRYAHLPKETRVFLERLRPEDIRHLHESMDFYTTARAVGRFNAWLIGGIVATVIAFAALGDGIRKMFGWIK